MSWVEDILVDAFLGGGLPDEDTSEGVGAAPEPAQLGWEYDRATGFYFHRSLGERFAEEGGVFYDDTDKKFYFYDEAVMRHEEMVEEQLAKLQTCAANAGLKLPGSAPEAVADDSVDGSAGAAAGVDRVPSASLEQAWQRPWEEWVQGHDAAVQMGLSFFATLEPPRVWALAKSSAQLFRHEEGSYRLVGAPILKVIVEHQKKNKKSSSGSSIGESDIEAELSAVDSILGAADDAAVQCTKGGMRDHQCAFRYHPGLECWQVRDIGSRSNTWMDGELLPSGAWTDVDFAAGSGHQDLVVGNTTVKLMQSQKEVASYSMDAAPGRSTTVFAGTFEMNPELLPPPPLSREVQMEFDNRLRRKAANRLSTNDRASQAHRALEYADRAEQRRQTRVEWDDAAAAARVHAIAAAALEDAGENSEDESQHKEALAEAGLDMDGSLLGAACSAPRAGIGYTEPQYPPEGQLTEVQKRRRITQERYQEILSRQQ